MEKRKYVARPGIEPRTPDLRVGCPTDCATRPGKYHRVAPSIILILVISIFLYPCESWTLTAELEKSMQAFEVECYRRLLNISCKDHVTNEDVRRKIQAANGKYDELLTLVKKQKLRWFGHISRSYDIAKMILQGTVQGKRRKCR